MSNDVKFTLTDAQLAAMAMLDESDAQAFVNSAIQSKLIAALTYNRKRIEESAEETYKAMEGYLKSQGMKMPQSFGEFKAAKLEAVQNALNELGYKPNKRKDGEAVEE